MDKRNSWKTRNDYAHPSNFIAETEYNYKISYGFGSVCVYENVHGKSIIGVIVCDCIWLEFRWVAYSHKKISQCALSR